jgi:hypothetical protein
MRLPLLSGFTSGMVNFYSFGRMRFFLALVLMATLFTACRPETYTPKPRGYYEIELPQRGYQVFNDPAFPYTFEYPVYGRVVRDTVFRGQKPENPYWINIEFPVLGGNIYVSYKKLSPTQPLARVLEDTYEMTMFHTKKADNIEEFVFHSDETNVHGIFYVVAGNAASAYQFYATDSTSHYMRGALYFDVSPNADSLRPVNEFLRVDIDHMLQTLKWK